MCALIHMHARLYRHRSDAREACYRSERAAIMARSCYDPWKLLCPVRPRRVGRYTANGTASEVFVDRCRAVAQSGSKPQNPADRTWSLNQDACLPAHVIGGLGIWESRQARRTWRSRPAEGFGNISWVSRIRGLEVSASRSRSRSRLEVKVRCQVDIREGCGLVGTTWQRTRRVEPTVLVGTVIGDVES